VGGEVAANALCALTLIRVAARQSARAAQGLLPTQHRSENPAPLSRTDTRPSRHRLAMEQVGLMKNPSTRMVYAYWNERRGIRAAPDRADIDPAAIRSALGDTIILAADFVDDIRFRLAGTRVCALFAREIKGEPFNSLWSEQSRPVVGELLGILTSENVGTVAGLSGRTADGDQVELEMLLLPLAHNEHARVRAIGVLVPSGPPFWLGAKPVMELTLGTLRHVGSALEIAAAPRFEPTQVGRRVCHGFTVYSGGRETPHNERIG